jgi:hypothetical protein
VPDIQQALFGYANGHQLLASSISLPSESARRLRAVTDMAFDGHARSYLTALPSPELRRYVLIRSWPALEAPRRGSVWSHALLIDFVVLTSLDDLGALTILFRRPQSNQPEELATYERGLSLPAARGDAGPNLPSGELDRLLFAVYGRDEDTVLRTDDPEAAEALLLAIWEQQWPRLRRAFAFRTRYQVSAQSGVFDVQVVERLERDQQQPQLPEPLPTWLGRLRSDLRDPAHRLSAFLRRFGTESPDGRRDLPTLVDVAELIWADVDRPSVIKLVGSAFKRADQMPTLKRALVGHTDDDVWPAPEAERLKLLLYAEPIAAFDLDDLKVEPRIDALWSRERGEARALLACVDFSSGENPGVRKALLSAAIRNAQPADLADVSEANPEVAIAVVKERSDLLAEPTLWQGDPALVDFLLDLLADAEPQTRQEMVLRQLDAGAFDAATRLIEREPGLWWQVLRWAAESGRPPHELAEILARLLDSVGAGAIGAMPDFERTPQLLMTLAVCVSPSLGLWRQVHGEQWQEVAKGWKKVPDRWGQLRMLVVMVAAAKGARREGVRRALWREAFPSLHTALVGDELSGPDLQTLIGLLPKPSGIQEWDYAGRLRAALAIEIRRDSWPRPDVADVVRAAEPYEEALLKALAAGKEKKKSWLRELTDQILP